MYDQLKSRLAELLVRPRPMKPQTERQLAQHLAEHSSGTVAFLLCASSVLEDHELDILFGPTFTPTLDERAEVADLLYHWRPNEGDVRRLIEELSAEVAHAIVQLPDGSHAPLTMHEVMADRFVRLMRLDSAPDARTAAALREVLPAELWPLSIALLCEPGMTPRHQLWFAAFVNHASALATMSRGFLETTAEFIATHRNLDPAFLASAAEALMRATDKTVTYAAGGHAYWSPDVAQHHQYRGQGNVDRDRLAAREAEVQHVAELVAALRSFDGSMGSS
jgi:hypothetical protein